MAAKRVAAGVSWTLLVLVALVLGAALPASAGQATYGDTQNDILYYDWETDDLYEVDHDPLDIHRIGINADAGGVTVSLDIVDLQQGAWELANTTFDVDGDGLADYEYYIGPQGEKELMAVDGPGDEGYPVACGGMGSTYDYNANRIVMAVARGCLGNTGGVGISVALFDMEDYACDCNDMAMDLWPNQIDTFGPRVPYDDATTPPPSSGYDPNGPMGTIYRLYRAYFLREPDSAGYEYWLGVYRNGYPLTDISENFTRSREFQQTYGNLDIPQYIRMVYVNVLGREPDAAGYNYWADQMANRGMPRGVVMINFSDSQEFRSKTASGRPPGY